MTHLRKTLVVAGHGMVGHRFVQAAIERGLTETYDVVVVGEEPRPAYDRVALTSFFSVESADGAVAAARGVVRRPAGAAGARHRRSSRSTPTPGRSRCPTAGCSAYDALVLATGAAPFVPPIAGRELDGCFVYRTIEDLEAIRAASAHGHLGGRDRRRAARPGGRQRAGPARAGDPRRRDGAPAHAGPARRGGRRHAGAPHREARRPGARRRGDQGDPRRCGRTAGTGRRRAGHRTGDRGRRHRDRPGGVLGRHPPARPAGPRRRARHGRAGRRARRRAVPHLRPARLRDRRVRGARRPDVRPGRARLRRWPRWSPTRCSTGPARSPAPTCPPSSSCSASTWRPSATRSPPPRARWSWSSPTPSAGVYKKLVVTRRTATRCSAASWSATPRRTASSGRWSPAASSCPPTRRT